MKQKVHIKTGSHALFAKKYTFKTIMKQNIDILKEVNVEMYRFKAKLALAIQEQSTPDNYSRRHYAAVKRAAMDLKHELTKLTQDSRYKYGNNE